MSTNQMNQQDQRRMMMLNDPISRVIPKMAIPTIVAFLINSIYSLADTYFVSALGTNATAAVSVNASLDQLIMMTGSLLAIGANSYIARLLGEGKDKKASTVLSSAFFLAMGFGLCLTIVGVIFMTPMVRLLGATPTCEQYAIDYATYVLLAAPFMAGNFVMNQCLRSEGSATLSMVGMGFGGVLNCFLDPLFIFTFDMGVAGVAWATFLCQGISCILSVTVVICRLRKIKTEEKVLLFSSPILKKIAAIAIPSILQQSFVSVGNLFIQSLVNGYGSSVIAGYSAAIKLNTFCITSLSTLGNGVSGYTAQNVGANKFKRIDKGFTASLAMSLIITVPFSIAYFFFCDPLIMLFMEDSNASSLEIGREFLRITSPFYVPIAAKLMVDGILRGTGWMKSFMVTTFTDLILRVVFAYILSPIYGSKGIWLSWPIGWLLATLMSVIFYSVNRRSRKKQLNHMNT